MRYQVLDDAVRHARRFLDGLPDRRVGPEVSVEDLQLSLGGPLPEAPADPGRVIDELAHLADPGIMATPSSRFFGYVIGGALPVTVAADWLTSAWDQNAGLYSATPAASVVEEIAGSWLAQLFGLPAGTSYAFVTGAQMAHFTALAAARYHVLAKAGWNVNADGMNGAPRIRIIASEERHVTVDRALRYLGIGASQIEPVRADGQSRMHAGDVAEVLGKGSGPAIVCVQAGGINTGSFDDIGEVCDIAHEHGAWVHIDGAFGLWAAVSPELRHLVAGLERADSWTTDGHKWLNVPFDSGFAFCAHPESHNAAVGVHADYLIQSSAERDPMNWTPEFSRRARGFTAYAAIRALGRTGIAEMIEQSCRCARRFAERLGAETGIEILNDVVLNQVLVSFTNDAGEDVTHHVVEGVQLDGTCWLSGSTWKGRPVMRISVVNWSTTFEDVDLSVEAIMRVFRSRR